jgi:tRNA(fMet)-specific endonuclease VapC
MNAAVLDADILSDRLKLKKHAVLERALEYNAGHSVITLSAITRHEVIRGYRQVNAVNRLSGFMEFCKRSLVLPVTDVILDRAAELWVAAGKVGCTRDDADLIVAGTALEHGLVLVTGNTAHFAWIPGPTVENWRNP